MPGIGRAKALMMEDSIPDSQTKDYSGFARVLRLISILMIIAGLVMFTRVLPVERAIDAMDSLAQTHPVATMGIFIIVYILACVLMLPGSLLTLAAGVIFGVVWGTVAVSVGSVTGAAMAFLIARYVARDSFSKKIEKYPKFRAIDKAIGDGGWKIVAMLRLSPAVPFNLQNYLYGLTRIRFWTCVGTSWLAMLPGTVMYVYIGFVTKQGVQAAAGSQQAASTGKWVLTGVGLLATVAVTVYVTKLATKTIREQTDIEADAEESTDEKTDEGADNKSNLQRPVIMFLIGAVILAAGAIGMANKERIESWFPAKAVVDDSPEQVESTQ